VRDALEHWPISSYGLDGLPVAMFERSRDLVGDGAVILVDRGGVPPAPYDAALGCWRRRTRMDPASRRRRLAAYQLDDIRQKTSYLGELADEDRDQCFQTLHRLHAARHHMRIIPSHDYLASSTLLPDACESRV
jgi:hypothetical protein